MSVILDIDLDYFALFEQPIHELERLLAWAGRPIDFVVRHHHETYARWKQMVAAAAVGRPHLIIHVDEHHDMMSERPPANFGYPGSIIEKRRIGNKTRSLLYVIR